MKTMDIETLRKTFLEMTHPKTLSDCCSILERYLNYYFSVLTSKQEETSKSLIDADAKIVNQMIFLKILSIKKILEGVEYEGRTGLRINAVVDPTMLISMVRNVYETVAMFHLVYLKSNGPEERLIIYSLWVIAGLNYRQRFVTNIISEYGEHKLKDEKETIEHFRKTITETSLYSGLSLKNKEKIDRAIKEKDYRIVFEDKEIKVFNSWQQLNQIMGCKPQIFENIYTYFSLYAHPSNVSVFTFADMFKKDSEEFKRLAITNTGFLFVLLSIFAADYIKVFPETATIFNDLALEDQILINHHNIFARNESYSINDAWKELG